MPKLLLLFLGCLLSATSIAQTAPAFPDTPTITETSVGKARIGMPISKLKELYKGYTFTPTYMASYGFDDPTDKPNGVTVSFGRQKLFVYFADWETHKKVAGLLAFHPAYKTGQGIHPGATSGQLRTVLPATRVVPNMLLPNIEMAFVSQREDENPAVQYIFFKQGHIGKYIIADTPVKIAVANARISWIQVYPR